MAKRKKPCDVPSITTFFAMKSRPGIGPSIDSSTSMFSQNESPSESPSPRCEVESSVFTTPGDVSPVAELANYWIACGLETAFLKYNCLLKMEPSSNPSSYPLI